MPKHFVKSLILISFVLSFAVGVAAQNDCGLAGAPKLSGFNLGMSPAEAQAVVGNDLKIKVKQSGQRTFFQNFINEAAPNSLRGVRALFLRFLDGRLYQIEIFYEDRNDLQTLADWTANLTAAMNLPPNIWQIKQNIASVKCGVFLLTAHKILNPYVELTDEPARAKVEAMRKKNAE